MGDTKTSRKLFLISMALIYVCAFISIYVQIPGLYGDNGVLPVRLQMPNPQRPLLEQIQSSPSLLWLAPSLHLEPQQLLEVISLLGVALSLAAVLLARFRDSLLFFCLWALYLSLYTVGGDFLHAEWDVLLLEAGFLAVLVAPLGLVCGRSSYRSHDPVSFWLTRWLFFRLTLCSGVSKLATGDPAWYGLSALSHHFENQMSPSPLAWYVRQLPDWLLRLGAVVLLHSGICVPLLTTFAPIRRLRLFGFYVQLFIQLFHILIGNCSLLNLLTVALSFSLLDDEHFSRKKGLEKKLRGCSQVLGSFVVLLVELAISVLIVFSAVMLYKLQIDWEHKAVTAKTDFNKGKFEAFVLHIQEPTIWIGVMSFTWEAVAAMLNCWFARGIMSKLWSLVQWTVITTAAVAIFALSVVPYSTLPGMSSTIVLPRLRDLHQAVEKYQLVGAYGVKHIMISEGRPEIILEGSNDGQMWIEMNSEFKPGNVNALPAIAGPHQPRLEWMMWQAAQGGLQQSPWFVGLVQRLLQGKPDVVGLLQSDEARYPFSQKPPALIRAKLYHYQLTHAAKDKTHPNAWWKRQYKSEFFPAVSLNDPKLHTLLDESGLKEKSPLQPVLETSVSQALSLIRNPIKGLSGALVIWTLFASLASIVLLKVVFSSCTGRQKSRSTAAEHKHRKAKEPCEAAEKSASNRAAKKDSSERKVDSDKSPRKRK